MNSIEPLLKGLPAGLPTIVLVVCLSFLLPGDFTFRITLTVIIGGQ